MLFDITNSTVEVLNDALFVQQQVTVSVLRLDKIHPVVSGNKLFKLQHFLQEAAAANKPVLTFGGAYSNHLVATAFACKEWGLKSIGIVRGEEPTTLSPTLLQCREYGMQLHFISREAYAEKENPLLLDALIKEFGECTIIPEGGYHPLGAKGAAHIMELIHKKGYTHICTAIGTGTTLAGLVSVAEPGQQIIGVNVLKGMTDIAERMQFLLNNQSVRSLQIMEGYDFGGYAKKTHLLLQFMNDCWIKYKLPLDFVYTAKMLYAIIDTIKNNGFPKNSQILCLHTGGLQGNNSLPLGALVY